MLLFLDKKSQRSKDENGFLIVKNNPIAKAGVFEYLHSELFVDSEDNTIVKVYRDFEDLKAIKDTFANKPIVHNHQWVGEETNQVDGAIGSEITIDEDNQTLNADLIIYNPKLIEAIEKGLDVELSPAYTGDVTEKSGQFNGQSYSYIQTVGYANHLAVVENGRAGKDLKIQDNKPNQIGEKEMKAEDKKFIDTLKRILSFKDEESKQEDTKVEDKEGESIKSILDSDISDSEKIEKIKALEESKTKDEDLDKKEEKKEDELPTEENSEDVDNKAEEIAEVIADVVKKEVEKQFADSKKEVKRISDTYTKVSDAIGSSFDYSDMSVNDIYKFGYETITGAKLDKDLDPHTAFLMASSKTRSEFKDNASTQKESSILSALNKIK